MTSVREQIVDMLEEALAIIEDEESYIKTGFAVNVKGEQVREESPEADRFSAFAAIARVGKRMGVDGGTIHHARGALESTMPMGTFKSLTFFERDKTHADVVQLFEATLKRIR